jgi:hypothetical protein
MPEEAVLMLYGQYRPVVRQPIVKATASALWLHQWFVVGPVHHFILVTVEYADGSIDRVKFRMD